MKRDAYPVILKPTEDGYCVYVPDFDIYTQGEDLVDAIEMARDAVSITGLDYIEDGKDWPKPGSVKVEEEPGDIITLVDVDIKAYSEYLLNKKDTNFYSLDEVEKELGL